MMACLPTSLKAICCALWRAVVAMGIAEATMSGYMTAHSRACMPPIEPPATASRRSMPRCLTSMCCKRTMSAMVMPGNDSAYGLPVAGLMEDGPVVPRQPPSTFEQIMKYLLVSKALPGPIMLSHQPGLPSSGQMPAACASPVKACTIRMALSRAAFRVPYVS